MTRFNKVPIDINYGYLRQLPQKDYDGDYAVLDAALGVTGGYSATRLTAGCADVGLRAGDVIVYDDNGPWVHVLREVEGTDG